MSATAFPAPALRPMLPDDVEVIKVIFQASVEELTEDDYDEGQRRAWAAVAEEPAFAERLHAALTLVATIAGSPVGFIALGDNRDILMLYVHPAVARQGIGAMLYDAVEKLARARGSESLAVDASDTARSFFEAKGFEARHRQTVELGDEWLGNTRMTRQLSAS